MSGVTIKRLGLAVVVVGVLVFGAEGILSLLRQRNIDVIVQVADSTAASATPAATSELSSSEAKPHVLAISPPGGVEILVRWNYRIGPRFPITVVRAEALDNNQQIVASDTFTIDCGNATLDCSGEHSLALYFRVKDSQGQRGLWPLGDYVLRITRAYADLSPAVLKTQPFEVAPQP
jgi:hypothetical protein